MNLNRIKRLVPETHPVRLLWHRSKAMAAALRYGFPAWKLKVIGVTGTDGKTTTVNMIAHILQENGIAAGALTTAFFRIRDQIEWNATQKTSPSPFVIQKFLRRLVQEGCTHAVLEYSSHGLVQGRTMFTYPRVAAITNISEEHLDYHGTMENYIDAKATLFRMLNWNNVQGKKLSLANIFTKPMGTKVLHYSDRSYDTLKDIVTAQTFTYNRTDVQKYQEWDGMDRSSPGMKSVINVWAKDVHTTEKGTTATIVLGGRELPLILPLAGAFNLDNALCAIACCRAEPIQLSFSSILAALTTFTGVPGRMEQIKEGQNFSVFIDFTVTPQSYEATLSTLKTMLPEGKRLLVLMGSCGDRMKEKRPMIGKIASNYADEIVVTNEDPYTEDPEKIIDEVLSGIDQKKVSTHRISDRKEAIEFLLKKAKKDDIVILCGKGSDTTMWVKGGQIPWNEREITKELLRNL